MNTLVRSHTRVYSPFCSHELVNGLGGKTIVADGEQKGERCRHPDARWNEALQRKIDSQTSMISAALATQNPVSLPCFRSDLKISMVAGHAVCTKRNLQMLFRGSPPRSTLKSKTCGMQ